jgi:hypothetical protein
LDEAGLAVALQRVTTPTPGLGRRSVPIARAQLLAWALHVAGGHPELPLPDALAAALPTAAVVAGGLDGDLPPPPSLPPRSQPLAVDLSARIAAWAATATSSAVAVHAAICEEQS